MSRRMRPVGAWLVLLTLLVGAGVALGPVAAQAATDSITDLSVDYDIAADGSVAVRYEIDWHFSSEGRHGIDFAIATRESWDADRTKDVVYDVSGVSVSSPSGAPDTFTQKEVEAGSVGQLELRIGDRDQTVDGQKATYVISYELRGALRTFDGQPEFFWDVTSEDYPDIENFTARVTAPGEIRKSRCLVGTSECDTEISDRGAVFTGSEVGRGEVLSVVAGLAPGTVSDAEPMLEPALQAVAIRDKRIAIGGSIAAFTGLAVLGSVLGCVRLRADRRWSGVPPGLTTGTAAPTRRVTRDDVAPVRFEAPECSLLLAGLVWDRREQPRHTAALLVRMATGGVVELQSRPLKVKKIAEGKALDPVEAQLYDSATMRATPIGQKRLRKMNRAVEKEQDTLVKDASLFFTGRGGGQRHRALFLVAGGIFFLFPVGFMLIPGWLGPHGMWITTAAVLGAIIGLAIGWRRPAPLSLKPRGTALRDQVAGFHQYIATAEANQLDSEADQDIYRRYLPWAVLFGLTKRWTKVCQELVDAGSIPALDTSFWVGAGSAVSIAGSMSSLSSGLGSAGTSASSGFFSGGGSGGSSGFSGGSSGGGGGGTSAGSW